jgi:molybdopterin-guanine dinucleotide biosynthesis protein A
MKPAIVIAAGGEGRRIGGGKPERLLGGRRLLDHGLAFACAQSDCVALAVRDVAQVGEPRVPLLGDAQPGIGPISALLSAFGFAAQKGRETVLLIGCDQPFLPDDLTARLGAKLGDARVAMPVSNGRYQPLAALWRPNAAALADYIAGGGQSLWRFAEAQGVVHVEWPAAGPVDPFANINDPDGLAAAEHHFSTPAQTPAR